MGTHRLLRYIVIIIIIILAFINYMTIFELDKPKDKPCTRLPLYNTVGVSD